MHQDQCEEFACRGYSNLKGQLPSITTTHVQLNPDNLNTR